MRRKCSLVIAAAAAAVIAFSAPASAAPERHVTAEISALDAGLVSRAMLAPSTEATPAPAPEITPMSATSCQATIGSLGAVQCFTAVSPGILPTVRVESLRLEYTSSANICNETYQFKYKLKGNSAYTITTKTDAGCSFGYATYRLDLNRDMVNGSQVCGRQKNNSTVQVYTGWYCHDVWG